jgi:hypothetical protein
MAMAGILWISRIGTTPDYAGEMLPGLIVLGIAGGLSQAPAPLFAASGTPPAERATTGSAVLNMSRQIAKRRGCGRADRAERQRRRAVGRVPVTVQGP